MGYALLLTVIIVLILIIIIIYATSTPFTPAAPEVTDTIPPVAIAFGPGVEEEVGTGLEEGVGIGTGLKEVEQVEDIGAGSGAEYVVTMGVARHFHLEALIAAANNASTIVVVDPESLKYHLMIRRVGTPESLHADLLDCAASEGITIPPNITTTELWQLLLAKTHYSVPLSNGYPIYLGATTVFHFKIINFATYPIDSDQIILPSKIESSPTLNPPHSPLSNHSTPSPNPPPVGTNSSPRIPKIIHQTFESLVVPKPLAQCAQQWRNLNPDYTWWYWTARDRRNLIRDHFEPIVLQTYDTLYPGAFKADLWRCCAVYQYGGVYADIKLFPLVPLASMLTPQTDLLLTLDYRTYGFIERFWYNAFFACPPHHPLVKGVIDRIVENVSNRVQPNGAFEILNISGPGAWRDVIRTATNQPAGHKYTEGSYTDPNWGQVTILGHNFNFGQPHSVVNGQAHHVLLAQPPITTPINYWNITGKPRYDSAPIYVISTPNPISTP